MKLVLRDARVEVNGVNISDHIQEVSVESEFDEVEQTAMGATFKEQNQGLGDATITCQAYSDYAAGALDSVMWPIFSAGTAVVVKVRPTSGAISTSNPEYSMTAKLFSFNPIAGSVGESAMTPLTFRNATQAGLQRATS
jgi:hypothetical protein